MRKCLAAALFVLSLLPAVAAAAETPALARAKDKEHALDFDGAIAIYDGLIGKTPNDPRLYALRAEDVWILGNYKKAVADFSKALALDAKPPFVLNHADLYNKRGEATWYGGNPRAAIPDYDRAAALDPKNEFLFSDRGEIKLSIGDCAGAAADYSAALALAKKPDAGFLQNRGTARLCAGDVARAAEDYRQAAALEQAGEPTVMHVLALNAWALGAYGGKKAEADKTLAAQLAAVSKINQDTDAARVFLGQADEVILAQDAASLKRMHPDLAPAFDSAAFFYAGLKQMADGKLTAARANFQKVLAIKEPFEDVQDFSRAWLKEIARRDGKP